MKMTEFEQAKLIAEKILNEPNADPDRDEAIVARQFNRLVERRQMLHPWLVASEWYQESAIFRCINHNMGPLGEPYEKIPLDVCSCEFAEWLTNQYRLAMAKGIQMANDANSG